ncbi:MAG: hypothetical protein GMKNLPBB_00191 [Myxococcota bacterium]|nr:hypothetical protein [Myxococcota bacterium]
MGFSIRIIEGPQRGEEYFFADAEVVAGREESNSFWLKDKQCSRKHFSITIEDGRHVLRDLGSANGTLLNGQPAEAEYLETGDEIRAGATAMQFTALDSSSTDKRVLQAADQQTSRTNVRRLQGPGSYPGSGNGALPKQTDEVTLHPGPGKLGEARAKLPSAAQIRERLIHGFAGLSFRMKAAIVLSFSAILAGFLGWILYSILNPESGWTDQSNRSFDYSAIKPGTRYGYSHSGKVDVQCKAQCQFRFPFTGGVVTVVYDIGSSDQLGKGDIEILINDHVIGPAAAAWGKWESCNSIDIPRDKLLKDSENLLVFRNTTMDEETGEAKPWGLKNLKIIEDAIPNPSESRADEKFRVAKDRYNARKREEKALFLAWKDLREAKLYLEGMESKPLLYSEVTSLLRTVTDELEKKGAELFFEYKMYRSGQDDLQSAKARLETLLKYFPEPNSCRHRLAKDELIELKEEMDMMAEDETAASGGE